MSEFTKSDIYKLDKLEIIAEILARGEKIQSTDTTDILRKILGNIVEKPIIPLTNKDIEDITKELDIIESHIIELENKSNLDNSLTEAEKSQFIVKAKHYLRRTIRVKEYQDPQLNNKEVEQRIEDTLVRIRRFLKEKTVKEIGTDNQQITQENQTALTKPTTQINPTAETNPTILDNLIQFDTRNMDNLSGPSKQTAMVKENVQRTHKSKAPMMTPKSFEGNIGESATDFLENFRIACVVNGWCGEERTNFLPCYLQGAALTWYANNVIDKNYTWDQVVHFFLEAHKDESLKTVLSFKLKNKKFQPNDESANTYIQYVQDTCRKIDPNMPKNTVKEYLLNGLDKDIFKQVLICGADTLEDVIKNIKKIAGIDRVCTLQNLNIDPTQCLAMSNAVIIPNPNPISSHINKEVQVLSEEIQVCKIAMDELRESITKIGKTSQNTNYNNNRYQNYRGNNRHTNYQGYNNQSKTNARQREAGRTGDGRPICYYCNRIGHLARVCWEKTNFNNRNKNFNKHNNLGNDKSAPGGGA